MAPILTHLEASGDLDGTESPFVIFLICYRVPAAADDGRAANSLASAHQMLQTRAADIVDKRYRSFLTGVAAHNKWGQAGCSKSAAAA